MVLSSHFAPHLVFLYPLVGILFPFLRRTRVSKTSVRQRTVSVVYNGNPQIEKKIFINPTSDRGHISKIYRELNKLHSREPNNPIKKRSTELHNELSENA